MGDSCCGKIQDWCRDLCGCCPCSCCKTVQVHLTLETVEKDKTTFKKDIPYGYARVYAGVCKTDGLYTSPILEIHTWRKEMMKTNMNAATVSQRVALGGMQTERDNADQHLGPVRKVQHCKIEMDEKIQCIPIESIISINYSGEVKKEQTEQTHARLNTPPPQSELSCCDKVIRWYRMTFCCCCNNSNKQLCVDPVLTISNIVGEKSQRANLITIEYIRYSNIDSPSHLHALATTDAAGYYIERLHTDPLQFYLLNNEDFEQADFDLKRMQGSSLGRFVTQLKAMTGQYPDEPTLQDIIAKEEILATGEQPTETLNQLFGPETATMNQRF